MKFAQAATILPVLLAPLLATVRGQEPPRLGAVRIEGAGADWMRGPLDSLPGKPALRDTVREALVRSVDQAREKGFLAASATADSLSEDGTLHLRASPSQRFVWSGMRNRGNSRLRPLSLWRLSGLEAGQDADPGRIDAAVLRVLATGYVTESGPRSLGRVPRSAQALVIVDLQDLPSSSIEGAGAWSQDADPLLNLEVELADLAGTARDFGFGISQGGTFLRAHLDYREPWIGPWSVAALVHAAIAQDSLARWERLSVDLEWALGDGRSRLRAGLATSRSAEIPPGDTAFGPVAREWSSRLAGIWQESPPRPWPVRKTYLELGLEAALRDADTAGRGLLRMEGGFDLRRPLGPAMVRTGTDARLVLPLDRSVGRAEFRPAGGIRRWRGWTEEGLSTPCWLRGTLESGWGSSASGGVTVFFEPGIYTARSESGRWISRSAWSSGSQVTLLLPRWEVELVVSLRDDTPRWNESLLSVRAANRF